MTVTKKQISHNNDVKLINEAIIISDNMRNSKNGLVKRMSARLKAAVDDLNVEEVQKIRMECDTDWPEYWECYLFDIENTFTKEWQNVVRNLQLENDFELEDTAFRLEMMTKSEAVRFMHENGDLWLKYWNEPVK